MNYSYYTFIALALAKERVEEANQYRLAALAAEGRPSSTSALRRSVARGLAAVSRGSASVVRRLDGCIADELGRELAPTE